MHKNHSHYLISSLDMSVVSLWLLMFVCYPPSTSCLSTFAFSSALCVLIHVRRMMDFSRYYLFRRQPLTRRKNQSTIRVQESFQNIKFNGVEAISGVYCREENNQVSSCNISWHSNT